MIVVEFDFTNVRPKPERLRFFIAQFGIEAEYEFQCEEVGQDVLTVRSDLKIGGGVLTKVIPITAYREELDLSNASGRELARETEFKTGEVKRQKMAWDDLSLPSTAETPWVLEATWKKLLEEKIEEVKFKFYDGRSVVAGSLFMKERFRNVGSGRARLIVESAKRFEADLDFHGYLLRSLSVEMPVIGKLRLNRRDD